MINRILLFSINNKFIISLFVIALIIKGIFEIKNLSIDAVPDITNNQVQIITTAPSFAAQDIERKVTFPIEQECSTIPGIKEIRSFSRFGLSLITVVFEDDIDIYWARQQVSEKIQKAQDIISSDIGKPELAPITTGLGEIYQYIIRAAKGFEHRYTLTQLREIQDWIVRRQLLGTKGVADVSSFGGLAKQIEISINPYQLKSNNISLTEIFSALEKNNQNVGSAYIEKNSTAYFIRTEGIISNIEDIENIVIKHSANGLPIQIKDIAKVKISNAVRYGSLVYTSENGDESYEVAGGIVMMLKGENSNEVIERVKSKIQDIQKTLPEGVIIEPFLDRTKMVNSTIKTVFKNLLEGAIIVIVVLVIFLGNIRYGLLVASIIPLSMLFAIILMNTFKVSGNLMSLGALDFGLIVDGAVIIVESVLYYVSKLKSKNKLSEEVANQLVFTSTSKLMNAAVFGQIIILIVYIPVLYFSGIEGKMFKPMAQTVLFALVGAFVLSITYIPVMSSLMIKNGKVHHFHFSEKLMIWVEKLYLKFFKKLFRRGKLLLTVMIILFVISMILLNTLGGEFMPTLEEGDFAVETRLITGTSLSTTIDYCKKASRVLAINFPDEVEKVVSKIGSAEIPTDPMPIESADMMVILKPVSQWKKAKTFDELANQMQEVLNKNVVGISTSFQYPVQMRFNELIAGAKQDVVCKIFGENIDTLDKYAQILSEKIAQIKGVEGIYKEPIYGQPQLVISFDRKKLSHYNLSVHDVNMIVKSIKAGVQVGKFYQNERNFDIVVRLDSNFQSIENIKNILIVSDTSNVVTLGDIADISIKTDINQIQREDAKRRIIVGFNVRGRDVESVINELQNKVNKLNLPYGNFIKYGGSFENLQSAKERLMITVPIALLLILLMLYFSFNSIKISLLIYVTIPMSIIGGVLFLFFRQIPFSVSAGVGFIALFGIAVLNGIVLISEFNQLRKEHSNSLRIIFSGIIKRLRPVLMTATVASLGFFPMFINTGVGANVQRPLATVVIGGLISSTLLTLFVLPILYYHFVLQREKKISINKKFSLLIGLFFAFVYSSKNINAQEIVNYQTCIDSALKNYKPLQLQNIISEYQKELIKTGWNISKTSVQIQYGQYNGIYNDNAISIQQNLQFPSVYHYQKQILQNEWSIAELQKALDSKNIKATVTKLFYDIAVLSEKIKILNQIDSIYKDALRAIQLRYEKGDISSLEKNILSNNLLENQQLLLETQKEKSKLLILLRLLTNIKTIKDIEYTQPFIDVSNFNNSNIEQHPYLSIFRTQIQQQSLKIQLEKSKLLPDLFFGYTNQTLKGWGTDNLYYSLNKRFQYIHAGLDVPLFLKPFTHKIKAEKKLLQYSSLQYEWEKEKISSQFLQLLSEYEFNQKIIQQYQTLIIPNNQQIRKTAQINFQKGNISFLEWSNYIHQTIISEINYLNYLQNQNNIITQLQFITNQ